MPAASIEHTSKTCVCVFAIAGSWDALFGTWRKWAIQHHMLALASDNFRKTKTYLCALLASVLDSYSGQGESKLGSTATTRRVKQSHFGGPGAQVRRKGTPEGLWAPPEAQNGAKMAPTSIKNVSKIEELNDKRCLPLSRGGMSKAH